MERGYMRTYLANIILFMALAALVNACGGQAPRPLPDLPRKDWLAEDRQAPAPAAGSLYAADKKFSFRDLVYLAVQQSPALARSAINLDIQQTTLSSARWKALPEVHLMAIVTSNLTQYNRNLPHQEDYGNTKYQISYSGFFNNPVATYFDVQAQKELMSIAIATHKQVMGKCIMQIASLLVQIEARRESLDALEHSLDIARKQKNYAVTSGQYKTDIWSGPDIREDMARDLALQADAARMELTHLRNQLKSLVGLDRTQQLHVDTASIAREIQDFDPAALSWERCWEESTERYLLAQQVRLHDAGIMLAWAQYVPNISFVVNESPPNGQAQAANAQTDQFLHVTLNFPVLDWGRRYRDAQQARARKRQSRLDEVIRRQEYQQRWFAAQEQLSLSRARLRQRQHAEQSAARRLQAVTIFYERGGLGLPEFAQAQQAMQEARMARVNAQAAVRQNVLTCMDLTQTLQNRFLESAPVQEK